MDNSEAGMRNLFNVLRIIDVVSILFFILCMVLKQAPTGHVLDADFLRQLRFQRIFGRLCVIALVFGVFSIMSTAFAYFSLTGRGVDFKMKCGVILFIVMGVAFGAMYIQKVIQPITHEARVETVTIADKDQEYVGGRNNKHWRYFFVFSDGSKVKVSEDSYDDNEIGDPYYLVLCGDDPIAAFDPSEYRLPKH